MERHCGEEPSSRAEDVLELQGSSEVCCRCDTGVEVGVRQGSAPSRFLFAMLMDRLTDEVRRDSPWTMTFADDIVVCSESREQV